MLIKSLDTGKIIIILIVIVFYLRLFMLRGKKRRMGSEEGHRLKSMGRKASPEKGPQQPSLQVTSWWILVPGVLLMLLGLAVPELSFIPEAIRPYDWVAIALGGILFIFGFK